MSDDAIFMWKLQMARLRICRAIKAELDKLPECEELSREYLMIQQSIRGYRRANSPIERFVGSRRIENMTAAMIRGAVRGILTNIRERTYASVLVGKRKTGVKTAARELRLEVGFMWGHRVAKELYNLGYKDPDQFILDANRVKVNAKNIDLFECVSFNMRTGETRSLYVARVKLQGNYSFAIAYTAQLAIKRAEDIMQNVVLAELKKGENDAA